ncbi:MAG: hypothetical protein KME25_21460 [Symplocastrum torsivum CPER-KK1]|uniref:Uncharacterized protein n=1 Tax=Symplocastrum torsivum CPER-KK1 TaxID=450513 RepID=A0A951PMZ0_9CYAN|nr:hypothetical protein [Symplocastrum torsivum CPER-KK1]
MGKATFEAWHFARTAIASVTEVLDHHSTDMAPGGKKVVAICDRGYRTTFRHLDIRMPKSRIQFGSLKDARLPQL